LLQQTPLNNGQSIRRLLHLNQVGIEF